MSEKKLSDYLHLYLGCECEWKMYADVGRARIEASDLGSIEDFTYIKPILRPLSDMTDEETWEIFTWRKPGIKKNRILPLVGEEFRKMLNKGFDLFGLIESGLAIDKTKLNQQP